MPEYKMFNGIRYKEYTFSTGKKEANYICDQLRASGYLARTVKAKNGYVVYARKK